VAEGRGAKKPRIRKTAPTVRELAAATAEKPVKKPKRIKAPANAGKVIKPLGRVLSPVGRALKWLTPRYFINSWRELRQVTWPNRRETWRLTLAVFVFAVVFGALVAGVDKGLDVLFKHLVLR